MTVDNNNPDPTTLTDGEIETKENLGRRSVLSLLGAGLVGGAVASVASGCVVRATTPTITVRTPTRRQTGYTDGDSGSYADPAGYGRGVPTQVHSGYTDGDAGRYADPAGYGRGTYTSGLTDSDSGSYADAAGHGRRGYKE